MIICAALLIETDKDKLFPENMTIIPCLRHCHGYTILKNICPEMKLHIDAVEGFIDHKGNFYTREEALGHAIRCGQLSETARQYKSEHDEKMLFSEDLY